MNSWAGPCAASPCNTFGAASHHAACVADTPFVHSHSRAWSRHQVSCRCCLLRPVTPHAVAEPSRACGLTAQARPTSSASSSLHCSTPPMPACLGSSCSNCCVATARLGRCQFGRPKARCCRRRPRRISCAVNTASGLEVQGADALWVRWLLEPKPRQTSLQPQPPRCAQRCRLSAAWSN